MKIATAKQMYEIDKQAVEKFGLPMAVLMETAGSVTADEIQRMFTCVQDKRIIIICGHGNNGGDGFVAARYLANSGARIRVFIKGSSEDYTAEPPMYLKILMAMKIDIIELKDDRDFDKLQIGLSFADVIIDALLGTGITGPVRDDYAKIINMINKSGKKVISIDTPSGIDANNGQIQGCAVKAEHTITLCLPKLGLLLYPGRIYAGEIIIKPIGIPGELLNSSSINQTIITDKMLREILPTRPADAHKGTNGHVLIVAGSVGYTGAPYLCAKGALRAGAGLVTMAVPQKIYPIVAAKCHEPIVRPLPESTCEGLSSNAVLEIYNLLGACQVLAIGPGLGNNKETQEAVRDIIKNADKPLVIDADGINALKGHMHILSQTEGLTVITPHPGELSRLLGLTPKEINQDRVAISRKCAVDWQCVVVLKGVPTVAAFPDGEVYINTTGNEGMSTGGTGDILTGMIASFIGQGMSPQYAAIAGIYLHGIAGDIAAERGKIGILAGELADCICAAINSVRQS